MRGAEHSVAPPCATAVHRKGSKGLLLAGSGCPSCGRWLAWRLWPEGMGCCTRMKGKQSWCWLWWQPRHGPCFTCSHLPPAPEEHVPLYASIFPASHRRLCGSAFILPVQKIEISISPSIFEELRFLSPWIIWLALSYAAFAASLLYNCCCSQYSVIQPHSSL